MLFTPYNQLQPKQKILVARKIISRTKAPQHIVDEALTIINPKVKILNHNVITIYHMLNRVQQMIKEKVKDIP